MKKNLQTTFLTRQYMLSKDFEIYYYNDKNMPEVGLHTHDFYEFYFFLEGSVSIQIGGEIYPLRFGDVILMLPGISHRPIIHGRNIPYRRFVLWISRAYYEQLRTLSPDYGYLTEYAKNSKTYIYHNKQIAFNTIQSMILHLLEELHAERFGRGAQLNLCMQQLLLHLNRTIYERNHPKAQNTEQSLYHNVLTYIEDHIEEDLSLDNLATVFFVSKYHISHVKNGGNRQELHEKIRTLSMEAGRNVKVEGKDNNLLELIAADPEFNLTLYQLQAAMEPSKYVGRAPVQVDNFLNKVVKPVLDANQSELGIKAEINV